MDYSRAEPFPLICPTCRASSIVKVWLIVDGESRPDLLTAIVENKLNRTTCPNGHPLEADFPILLFRVPDKPILVFSPAFTASEETEPQQMALLLDTLRKKLGSDWQESWREEIKTIFRPLLPLMARPDPNNLLEKLTTPRSKLFADWPVLKELEDKGELNDFWAWLLAFVQIGELGESPVDESSDGESSAFQKIISDIENEENDEIMDIWTDSLDNKEAADIFKHHRALFRRFQELGEDD